jgi:hypothetical protein
VPFICSPPRPSTGRDGGCAHASPSRSWIATSAMTMPNGISTSAYPRKLWLLLCASCVGGRCAVCNQPFLFGGLWRLVVSLVAHGTAAFISCEGPATSVFVEVRACSRNGLALRCGRRGAISLDAAASRTPLLSASLCC